MTPPSSDEDPLVAHLEAALEHATDETARYHIRAALQQREVPDAVRDSLSC